MSGKSSTTKLIYGLIAILIILILISLKQCNDGISLKNQLDIQDLNVSALKDSVRVTKNKFRGRNFRKKIFTCYE